MWGARKTLKAPSWSIWYPVRPKREGEEFCSWRDQVHVTASGGRGQGSLGAAGLSAALLCVHRTMCATLRARVRARSACPWRSLRGTCATTPLLVQRYLYSWRRPPFFPPLTLTFPAPAPSPADTHCRDPCIKSPTLLERNRMEQHKETGSALSSAKPTMPSLALPSGAWRQAKVRPALVDEKKGHICSSASRLAAAPAHLRRRWPVTQGHSQPPNLLSSTCHRLSISACALPRG